MCLLSLFTDELGNPMQIEVFFMFETASEITASSVNCKSRHVGPQMVLFSWPFQGGCSVSVSACDCRFGPDVVCVRVVFLFVRAWLCMFGLLCVHVC